MKAYQATLRCQASSTQGCREQDAQRLRHECYQTILVTRRRFVGDQVYRSARAANRKRCHLCVSRKRTRKKARGIPVVQRKETQAKGPALNDRRQDHDRQTTKKNVAKRRHFGTGREISSSPAKALGRFWYWLNARAGYVIIRRLHDRSISTVNSALASIFGGGHS